jgi:predicted MFS family arabinose efflux permease
LYAYYSLASFGAGIVWSLPLSTVQRWFIKNRGLALGIALSGIGVGTLVWAPVVNYLIYTFGWQSAYKVMGGVSWVVLTVAAMTITTPEKRGLEPIGAKGPFPSTVQSPAPAPPQLDTQQAMRSLQLWMICFLQLLFNIGLFLVFVHLVPYAIEKGMDKTAAAGAVGLIGAFSIAGKIVAPVFVENKMSARWEKGLALCVAGLGFVLLFLTVTDNIWKLTIFVTLFGFFYGNWTPMIVALTGSYYGLKSLGSILGFIQLGMIGGIIGPLVGGYILDRLGSYLIAILACAITFFIAAAIVFFMKPPEKKPDEWASSVY